MLSSYPFPTIYVENRKGGNAMIEEMNVSSACGIADPAPACGTKDPDAN